MVPEDFEGDPVLGELRARDDTARAAQAAYLDALMRRDGLVHATVTGVGGAPMRGPTAIGRAIRSDRTWPYKIARMWPSRLAEWRRAHPGWKHDTTQTSTPTGRH